MIDVTAAVCHRNGKLLICQRPQGKSCEFLWEFPGGKVEPGETLENCLKRELKEELNFSIKEIRPLTVIEKPEAGIRLHFFTCTPDQSEPEKMEHNAIRWITPAELSEYTFCPSDQALIDSTDPVLLTEERK